MPGFDLGNLGADLAPYLFGFVAVIGIAAAWFTLFEPIDD